MVYTIWWNYRITDTSTSELETEANEYVDLTMVDNCWDNAWTIGTPAQDIAFQIPANLATSTPASFTNSITASKSTCSKTESLEIFDSGENIWKDYTAGGSYPWIHAVSYGGGDTQTSASTISIETDNSGGLYDS